MASKDNIRPSDHALADRAARMEAWVAQDAIASWLGDPVKGRSALDQRLARQREQEAAPSISISARRGTHGPGLIAALQANEREREAKTGGSKTALPVFEPRRANGHESVSNETGFVHEEQIATQLGVSARTICEDLRNFEAASKSKPAKTASNPKGAGRPKGSSIARSSLERARARDAALAKIGMQIIPFLVRGYGKDEIASLLQVSRSVVAKVMMMSAPLS